MAFKQRASREQRGLPNPEDDQPDANVNGPAGAHLEQGNLVNADVSAPIKVIERSSAEKNGEATKRRGLSNNHLFVGLVITVVGGVITVGVGGILTNWYTIQQKELDSQRTLQQLQLTSQRSFSDELNKIRIQKIGEVWEQIDKNEVLIDGLLDKAKQPSNSTDQKNQHVDSINSLIQEDKMIVNKNRFWLGEEDYNKITKKYLDINTQLALNMLLARRGTPLTDIIDKRQQAKQDILQLREKMLSEGAHGK